MNGNLPTFIGVPLFVVSRNLTCFVVSVIFLHVHRLQLAARRTNDSFNLLLEQL